MIHYQIESVPCFVLLDKQGVQHSICSKHQVTQLAGLAAAALQPRTVQH
jgi:hypothetical protein